MAILWVMKYQALKGLKPSFLFLRMEQHKNKGGNQVWEVRFCPPVPPLAKATVCLVVERGSWVHLFGLNERPVCT